MRRLVCAVLAVAAMPACGILKNVKVVPCMDPTQPWCP